MAPFGKLERWDFENSVFVVWDRTDSYPCGKTETSSIFHYCDEEWQFKATQTLKKDPYCLGIFSIHNLTRQRSSGMVATFLTQFWVFVNTHPMLTEEMEQVYDQNQWKWELTPGNYGKFILCCRIFRTENKGLSLWWNLNLNHPIRKILNRHSVKSSKNLPWSCYFENSVFAISEMTIPHLMSYVSAEFYVNEEWKVNIKTDTSKRAATFAIHYLTGQSSSKESTTFLIQFWIICTPLAVVWKESEQTFDRSVWKWDFEQHFDNLPSKFFVCCRIFRTENKGPKRVGKYLPEEWSSIGVQALSDSLKTVVETGKHADVVLKLGDQTFPAHKMILSCRSRVFEAMFKHGTKESRNNVVDLVDMDAAVAKMMLQYIYTGKAEELSMDNMMDLYSVADRYSLKELLDQCRAYIIGHINVDNVYDVAIVADLHSDDDLMHEVQDFFCENSESILQSKKREMMAEKYSKLYIKLVETAVLRNKST